MATTVACPICRSPVRWEAGSRWRPFCSERCKLMDLGDWAAERHAIPGTEQTDVAASGEPPDDSVPRR